MYSVVQVEVSRYRVSCIEDSYGQGLVGWSIDKVVIVLLTLRTWYVNRFIKFVHEFSSNEKHKKKTIFKTVQKVSQNRFDFRVYGNGKHHKLLNTQFTCNNAYTVDDGIKADHMYR